MGAHFIPPEPATIADVRDAMDALLADAARVRYMRRQLEAAVDHGTALLDALDLPCLVEPDFVPLDRAAIGDAIDVVIDHLDALDAPDEDREPYLAGDYNERLDPTGEGEAQDDDEDGGDREPSLGAPENHPARFHEDMDGRPHFSRGRRQLGDQTNWNAGTNDDTEDTFADLEHEAGYDLPEGDDERCASGDVDQEHSCGWTAKVNQVHLGIAQEDHEETAVERHGKGFVRSGPEDTEDDDPVENDDGAGDEDSGIGDEDGMAEQLAGWSHCPALPHSVGGYVA